MSEKRTFYVSDPENYLQKEIVNHIVKNFPRFKIRASIPNQSTKPHSIPNITKILNRSKPKLFQNYLQQTETLFVDLLFNESIKEDVEMICEAMKKLKSFPSKIKIVAISSILSWANTNTTLISLLDKSEQKNEQSGENLDENTNRTNTQKLDKSASNSQEDVSPIETQRKSDDIVNVKTNHFHLRSSTANHQEKKDLEDKLAELAILNENIEVHIFYAGLIYGKEQLILKNFFKKAWTGEPIPLFKDEPSNQHKIPTINLEFFVKSIFKIIDDETIRPEFTNYEMHKRALEKYEKQIAERILQEKMTPIKNPVMSGEIDEKKHSGDQNEDEDTNSEHHSDQKNVDKSDQQKTDSVNNETARQIDLEKEISEENLPVPSTLRVYFLFEPKVLTYKEIMEALNKSLGSGETYFEDFVDFDPHEIMLFDHKMIADGVIDQLYSGIEDHFIKNLPKTIKEFCEHNNLKPIRIIINKELRFTSQIVNNIASHYKIPIINVEKFFEQLNKNPYFLKTASNFVGEDSELYRILTQDKCYLTNYLYDKNSNASKLIFAMLKYRLSLNDCIHRGFILCNIENILNSFDLKELLYVNDSSKNTFEKSIIATQKKHLRDLEKEKVRKKKEEEKQAKEQARLLRRELKIQEKLRQKAENEKNELTNNEQDSDRKKPSSDNVDESSPNNDQNEVVENEPKSETEEIEKEEENENDEKKIESAEEVELISSTKKVRESFFSNNIVILCQNDELSDDSKKLFSFGVEKNIDCFLRHFDFKNSSDDKKTLSQFANETTNELRVYIERVF